MAADLNWIISNQGDFLEKFGINQAKIIEEYETWKIDNADHLTTEGYFRELLRQASLYNIKHANTEEEYVNVNIEIISKWLKYPKGLLKENRDYLIQQLHLSKLNLSRLTLPFQFDIQIKSNDCCSYCDKKSNKVYSLEKILEKKYIPYPKCKNEEECKCSYSIVPLVDKKGHLLAKNN